MKKLIFVYVAGILTGYAYLLHLGGEKLVQLSLKLSAAEAQYDFVASPRFQQISEDRVAKTSPRRK